MMCALKSLGCTHIIATTAVLSLSPQMKPGDFVLISSFIDGTEGRMKSYYQENQYPIDEAIPIPKNMCKAFSEGMSKIIKRKADSLGIPCHVGGVVMTVEGPRFPSQMESRLFAKFGADILNFTTVPEVNLAMELGIHYVAIAMVTDFDPVFDVSKKGVKDILTTFQINAVNMKKLLMLALPDIASADWAAEYTKLDIPKKKPNYPQTLSLSGHWT